MIDPEIINLRIDPEFRDKIPSLTAEEFAKLEENILADGEVREPLVVWDDVIVDGHHRWKIIQKHPEIPYSVKHIDFPDKWAAIAWMCSNQLGRRNLSPIQRTYLIGKQLEAKKMSRGGDRKTPRDVSGKFTANLQNDGLREKSRGTAGIIADEHGISVAKVERSERVSKSLDEAEMVSPGFRESVLSGDIKSPNEIISEIRNIPDEKKAEVIDAIKTGDIDTAREITRCSKPYKPIPNATPVEPRPSYNLDDFKNELQSVVDDMDSSFKLTLVMVHREMLDSDDGCSVASVILENAHHTVKKYEEMIHRIKEMRNGTNC